MERINKERVELQGRLDSLKSPVERNKLGQFSTPAALADEIVRYSISLLPRGSRIRFLEPGFGTGPFFSSLLEREPSRIDIATGFEIDPIYYEAVKEFWKGSQLHIHNADFTIATPPEDQKYNLIVCNPPYVRHHHLSQEQKKALQSAVVRHVNFEMNGLSGLYTYFLILSKAWMSENGIGAWLIPSEFMDVNYGRKVKEFLTEKVTLLHIHRFDPKEVQFGDALVSSAVVFFKNADAPENHKVEFSFGGTLKKPNTCGYIKLADLRRVSKWTGLPQIISNPLEINTGGKLSDLFTVKRGLATGCNEFFILSDKKAKQLGLPKEFLRPILPSPRDVKSDEILADENEEPILTDKRYLLSCPLPENEIKLKYPTLWSYLEQGINEKVNDGYLCQHRKPWYSQEIRPASPFLCTYMGRTSKNGKSPFRFILNFSNATAANVYQMLYPKPVMLAWLNNNPDNFRAVLNALSSIKPEMLIGEGRVYGGGLHKLEPKELGNVPIGVILDALIGKEKCKVMGD